MDDARFAKQHGGEESYLFVVDSRTRDSSTWPSPSEYEVEFKTPFTNVFGLDLLDASVPRTEYIVEANSNRLEYALSQPSSLDDWSMGAWLHGKKRTVDLDPGDYNLPQFIEHLNVKLASVATAHGEQPLYAQARSNPAEITNKVVLACAVPFTLVMGTSTLRHTLGFGDPVAADLQAYRTIPGWSPNFTGGASDVFCSREVSDLGSVEERVATSGPVPASYQVQYQPLAGTLRQHFRSTATGLVSRALVYATAQGSSTVQVRILRATGQQLAVGSASVDVSPSDIYAPLNVSLAGQGLVQEGDDLVMEFTGTEGVGVYYNDENVPQQEGKYLTVDGLPAHPGMSACADLLVTAWAHAVTSPGQVNLTGPRYVNIRCPNIESYMFRDRVNESCHVGLGMVTLRGYGFRGQRLDFVSFPPRRFHMLGKVSKLRFRLERPDGSLYDSHGVDHTLLLVIKYYSAAATKTADFTSTLNPAYNPDLRQFLIHSKWASEARALDMTEKFYGGNAMERSRDRSWDPLRDPSRDRHRGQRP